MTERELRLSQALPRHARPRPSQDHPPSLIAGEEGRQEARGLPIPRQPAAPGRCGILLEGKSCVERSGERELRSSAQLQYQRLVLWHVARWSCCSSMWYGAAIKHCMGCGIMDTEAELGDVPEWEARFCLLCLAKCVVDLSLPFLPNPAPCSETSSSSPTFRSTALRTRTSRVCKLSSLSPRFAVSSSSFAPWLTLNARADSVISAPSPSAALFTSSPSPARKGQNRDPQGTVKKVSESVRTVPWGSRDSSNRRERRRSED